MFLYILNVFVECPVAYYKSWLLVARISGIGGMPSQCSGAPSGHDRCYWSNAATGHTPPNKAASAVLNVSQDTIA